LDASSVLVVQHVPWEGPHRIGRALERAGLTLDVRFPLDGDALPPQNEVAAAVFMGGPMNVDQTVEYPGLLAEREWLAAAIPAGLPILGVCLGSQLIARALGAEIVSGPAPEIGWAPVKIHDLSDPLAECLAPQATVLHWHGDIFRLPSGATHLASSEHTAVQGFRAHNAWGFLFHAEADDELTKAWLAEPSMRDEATAALGPDGPAQIEADAARHNEALMAASEPLFAKFAAIAAARAA
jgi:GMP synthase-like glutamine amidotransferase